MVDCRIGFKNKTKFLDLVVTFYAKSIILIYFRLN
jgi:hypothetical protein